MEGENVHQCPESIISQYSKAPTVVIMHEFELPEADSNICVWVDYQSSYTIYNPLGSAHSELLAYIILPGGHRVAKILQTLKLVDGLFFFTT